jgi:hypothetical protein
MIRKVVSGGQTGVDIAALRAAQACGLETGGWAPRGYLTELGPQRELLAGFGLREMPGDKYPPRTAANVRSADATLIIADSLDRGSKLTAELCAQMTKPMLHLARSELAGDEALEKALFWLRRIKPKTLNVAGNRETSAPGIEADTEVFLRRLFAALAG